MLSQALAEIGKSLAIRPKYDNFIGGKWVAPVKGQYFENISPITGKKICDVARSTEEDIELAVEAAHKAKEKWGKTSPAERSALLNKVADIVEKRLNLLALVETV